MKTICCTLCRGSGRLPALTETAVILPFPKAPAPERWNDQQLIAAFTAMFPFMGRPGDVIEFDAPEGAA